MDAPSKKSKRLSKALKKLGRKLRKEPDQLTKVTGPAPFIPDNPGQRVKDATAISPSGASPPKQAAKAEAVDRDYVEPSTAIEGPSAPPEYYTRGPDVARGTNRFSAGPILPKPEVPAAPRPWDDRTITWRTEYTKDLGQADKQGKQPSLVNKSAQDGSSEARHEDKDTWTKVFQKKPGPGKEKPDLLGKTDKNDTSLEGKHDKEDLKDKDKGPPNSSTMTHTGNDGSISYYSPPARRITTPGYEWASRAGGYDWDERSQIYGSGTMGEAYRRELTRRDQHQEAVIAKMRKLREEASKVRETTIAMRDGYH